MSCPAAPLTPGLGLLTPHLKELQGIPPAEMFSHTQGGTMTFTDKDGGTAEAIVWEATDLKNFPIQYQTVEEGLTTTTTFSDIKMEKPDASLFALPESYKRYANMQEVIMGNMQRMMQQPP